MKEYNKLKKKLNLYIEEKIADEDKELGLNISKVCENSLKLAIGQMKALYDQNTQN
jgi:post-segregation antitoxin (ccd killing protein)